MDIVIWVVLTVLEYWDCNDLLSREKYYFYLLLPEYNILKEPGSPFRDGGWTHTKETKDKWRASVLERCKEEEYLALYLLPKRRAKPDEVTDLRFTVLRLHITQ